jgi:hypothetical protein
MATRTMPKPSARVSGRTPCSRATRFGTFDFPRPSCPGAAGIATRQNRRNNGAPLAGNSTVLLISRPNKAGQVTRVLAGPGKVSCPEMHLRSKKFEKHREIAGHAPALTGLLPSFFPVPSKKNLLRGQEGSENGSQFKRGRRLPPGSLWGPSADQTPRSHPR